MTKALILGANGQIARIVRQRLLQETDVQLTLYLRQARRLGVIDPKREAVIEADVNDYQALYQAMADQDLVYANLGGPVAPLAKNIVKAMTAAAVNRLVYVAGLSLSPEVTGTFGRWREASTDQAGIAAQLIEASSLNYTLIRAAAMTNDDVIDYELTEKQATFKGTTVSRRSVAELIMQLIVNPTLHSYSSLGIDQPGTAGDRSY